MDLGGKNKYVPSRIFGPKRVTLETHLNSHHVKLSSYDWCTKILVFSNYHDSPM